MSDIQLSDVASQAGFARLVGTSRQAINKHVERGFLIHGQTYLEWLADYCERLRQEAAGRGGDQQATLTAVRIEETQENIAEKRQRRLTAAGELLDRGSTHNWIVESASGIQGFVIGAGDTIIESINEKYKIELESDDVTGPLRTALGHIASAGSELAERFCGVGEQPSAHPAHGHGAVE
ncbi:MAG: hypothetical protein RPT11_02945 [Bermanella sp.]